MPANTDLLAGLQAWYEFAGNYDDLLGLNPMLPQGTPTFPGGGGVHFDGVTSWLRVANTTFGALRSGERLAGWLDFKLDTAGVNGWLFGRDAEWYVTPSTDSKVYLNAVGLTGGQKFSNGDTVPALTRSRLYFEYDGAHLRTSLNGGAIVAGDALAVDLKVITGTTPAILTFGRNRDNSFNSAATIYRAAFWKRYGPTFPSSSTVLSAEEIAALYAATGPLWLPGRLDGLRPISRVTQYEIYRGAPDATHEALCFIFRVGPGAQRLQQTSSAANDQFSGQQGRLSPDDGVTLGAPFSIPDTSVSYPGVSGGFYGVAGVQWHQFPAPVNGKAGQAVRISQRQFTTGGGLISNHLVLDWSDDGETWTGGLELAYDAGTLPFNAADPANVGYVGKSEASPGPSGGCSMFVRDDGVLLIPAGNANDPADGSNATRVWKRGLKLGMLTWNGTTYTQAWSNTVAAPWSFVSGDRGFQEPAIVQFGPASSAPGRVLIVARTETGHAYFTYSDDGGVTLHAAAPWTFADGGSIEMASCSPNLIHDPDADKVYFRGMLSFPGVVVVSPGSMDTPRHPYVIGQVNGATNGLKRETLTDLLFRTSDQLDAVEYGNQTVIRRYGLPGKYEATFALLGLTAGVDRGDNYKWRDDLTEGALTPGIASIVFAGSFHYFLIKRGTLYWNPVALAWSGIGTGAARADFCTGLTQESGNSTGHFVPPAAGFVELVPYVMSGFQPADGDTAGDSAEWPTPAPPVPSGCLAALAGIS